MRDAVLRIQAPDTYRAERAYVARVLFDEFLGIPARVEYTERDDVCVRLAGDASAGCALHIDDVLFRTPREHWLRPESLPRRPLPRWGDAAGRVESWVVDRDMPLLFATRPAPERWIERAGHDLRLRFDLFGSVFFMLSGYEELARTERDRHGRFPASASLALHEGFLDRAIVNEYLELLWACVAQLWPHLSRREHAFRVQPTHDVDRALRFGLMSPLGAGRALLGALVRRQRSPLDVARQTLNYFAVKRGDASRDPGYLYDRIMDLSEQHGLRSEFYFIARRTSPTLDGNYELTHPLVRPLLRRIHARGHRIGLHASYTSESDPVRVAAELDRLRQLCAEDGVQQTSWGNRQHYLRWDPAVTARSLARAGFDYDTTLGYPDHAGFRRGTCYEFPLFDLVASETLPLRERPLIVMESTVIDPTYMGMGASEQARDYMLRLRATCKRFGGVFTCLWHNHRLEDAAEHDLYGSLISA
jgi:hypothetical protein